MGAPTGRSWVRYCGSMDEPWSWTETDLLQLIESGSQESLVLEYKASAALGKSDDQKNEISKDVSALANSAGGTIVYGIKREVAERRVWPCR